LTSDFLSNIPRELRIDTKEVVRYLTLRLRHYVFDYAHRQNAIIGLSGGVDSAVTCFLAVKALGAERTHVLLLPSRTTPPEDLKDADSIIHFLSIPQENVVKINIDEFVDRISSTVHVSDKVGVGNIKARVRMILLHAHAHKNSGLVIGTGDKSELTIGYFTKFGDGGVDVLLLGDLYKTQVRQIAAEVGIPKRVYTKPPSPALWENQTAETELGIDYTLLDQILYRRFDLWWDEYRIASDLNIDIKEVLRVIELVKKTQHKRLPAEIFRVSFRAHGSDWRYPREWR